MLIPSYSAFLRFSDFAWRATANLEKTVVSIRGFTLDCLDGAVEKGILYGTGVWDKGEVQSSAHMKTAYEMGLHS